MVKSQLNENIKVVQIYPFNNPVSLSKNKPVVMAGLPYAIYSKYYDNMIIISRANTHPYNDKVVGIVARNKKQYYKNIINFLNKILLVPSIIEVHQDVSLAVYISSKFKNLKVSVIRHGPALYRSFYDKIFFMRYIYAKFVLNKLTYIYCISEYTTNILKRNYPKYADKFITIYNSYGHLDLEIGNVNSILKRENIVTFVGKPVKKKGIFIFLKSIVKFLMIIPNWKVMIVAAKFSKKNKYSKVINRLKYNLKLSIYNLLLFEAIPIAEVFNKMLQSKVVVIPCIVSEPFCLVALEAHMAGCVVISSGRGALREVSGEYAYYLDTLNEENLLKTLLHINNNPNEAEQKALLGYQYALNKFDPKKLVIKLDNIRSNLINNINA